MRRSVAIFLGLACWAFFTTSALAVVPPLIPVQGRLADADGQVLDGSYDLTFTIYESLTASSDLWTETQTGVSVDQGFFSVYLGDEIALPIDVLVSAGELWLSMTVGGEELSRVQLASVPYALEAQVCRQLGDLEADEVQPVLSGAAACAPGQYLRGWDADAGAPLCSPDTTLDESTVEEHITDETINLHAGSTMNDLALSTGPHTTNLDWTAINNKPAGLAIGAQACADNNKMTGIDADGGIQCGTDLVLDETDVDTMVGNNGYVTNDIHCETGDVMTGISDLGAPECSWAYTGGALDMGSDSITSLADPSASTDAANKQYVDQQISETLVSPGVVASKDYFTVVMSMSASGECPAGYDSHDMAQIAGPTGWAYVNIMERGLFMGGLNTSARAGEYIHAEVYTTSASKLCSRRYEAGAGRPGFSLLAVSGGSAGTCPSGYDYLPSSALGTGTVRLLLNGSGAFLGPANSVAALAQEYNSDGGWQTRYWAAGFVDTYCYRVTGVEADPSTSKGTYPVVLGLDSTATCPEGWNNAPTDDLNGADNNYVDITYTNSSLIMGGASGQTYGGDNHLTVRFHSGQVDQVCWKEFATVDAPYFTVKTPGTGDCPVGDIAFDAAHVKNTSGYAYLVATGHALFIGGLHDWAYSDSTQGVIANTFTNQLANKLCLNIHGAI